MDTPPHDSAPVREGRRARKKREMRESLYRTAVSRFAEKGFSETRVEEITAELDVSPATFFNYFGNKDAVLLALAEELLATFEATLREIASAPERDDAVTLRTFGEAVTALSDAPPLTRALYADLLRVTLPHETGRRLVRRIREALADVLAQGQRRGSVRTDHSADDLAEIVAAMVSGTFDNWVNDPDTPLLDRVRKSAVFLEEALRPRDA